MRSAICHRPVPSRCHRALPFSLAAGARTLGPRGGRRTGRALVEVLVALVLLGVAGGSVVRLVRAALVAGDRITHLQLALALTREGAERLQLAPCAPVSGRVRQGRTELRSTGALQGPLGTLAFRTQVDARPAAGGAGVPRPLVARAAGWCR